MGGDAEAARYEGMETTFIPGLADSMKKKLERKDETYFEKYRRERSQKRKARKRARETAKSGLEDAGGDILGDDAGFADLDDLSFDDMDAVAAVEEERFNQSNNKKSKKKA